MNARSLRFAWVVLSLAGIGCGGAPHGNTTGPTHSEQNARRSIPGGEFVVVGRTDGSGDAYDATLLFDRANAAVRTHRCDAAMPDYERLLHEFPNSALVPATHYNRGVCLQSMGRADDALVSFRDAAAGTHERDILRDAWFRIAVIGESTQRPPLVLEATQAILAIPSLAIVDGVEAHARRGAAFLAQHDFDGATREAQESVNLAPTPEAVSALQDDTYAAEAKFILGEVTRQQAAAIDINVEDPNLDHAIERRVQLVVHAHVQFNEAIRIGNPHWAAACGYTIGDMYRSLYDAIVNAHVPADWDAHAIEIYRHRTGQRLRPLLTGALRAWEATLDMARRNGISDNDWARRTEQQIDGLRDLILNGTVATNASSAPPEARAASPDRNNPGAAASAAGSSASPTETSSGDAAGGGTDHGAGAAGHRGSGAAH